MDDEDQNESSTDQDSPTPDEEQADQDSPTTDEEQAEPSTDEEQTEPSTDEGGAASDEEQAQPSGGRVFSVYGIASTVLGIVSVAAIVVGLVLWSAHRDDVNESAYQSRVMRTAVGWASALINMNADNVDTTLLRLHDKTVGQLNADFDAAVRPYRELAQKLQSHTTGRIDSVAIESVRHEPDTQAGDQPQTPAQQSPPSVGRRTDTVMVVATSIAENTGGKPKVVHWDLSLDVSDVDDKLLISRLSSIR